MRRPIIWQRLNQNRTWRHGCDKSLPNPNSDRRECVLAEHGKTNGVTDDSVTLRLRNKGVTKLHHIYIYIYMQVLRLHILHTDHANFAIFFLGDTLKRRTQRLADVTRSAEHPSCNLCSLLERRSESARDAKRSAPGYRHCRRPYSISTILRAHDTTLIFGVARRQGAR